jgi:Tfp pilus assembly major pilin PilA
MRKQRGAGMMNVIFVLAVLGSVAWLAMKIAPFYVNNAKVANALENIKSQPEAARKNNSELQSDLLKRLGVEGIDRINRENFKDYVTIERTATGYNMTIAYDDLVPVKGELYVMVRFKKSISVP